MFPKLFFNILLLKLTPHGIYQSILYLCSASSRWLLYIGNLFCMNDKSCLSAPRHKAVNIITRSVAWHARLPLPTHSYRDYFLKNRKWCYVILRKIWSWYSVDDTMEAKFHIIKHGRLFIMVFYKSNLHKRYQHLHHHGGLTKPSMKWDINEQSHHTHSYGCDYLSL